MGAVGSDLDGSGPFRVGDDLDEQTSGEVVDDDAGIPGERHGQAVVDEDAASVVVGGQVADVRAVVPVDVVGGGVVRAVPVRARRQLEGAPSCGERLLDTVSGGDGGRAGYRMSSME